LPGNIRQLDNILEHAFVLCRRKVITPVELPVDFMPGAVAVRGGDDGGDEREIQAIREALERAEHNKSEAARPLGISRRTLYRKLERHTIEG
jgi:transcriptional regulator of acetoin/glycerol metabolism